ncbi:DNA/RNA helicase [Nonlabens dokdonensis]|uniref:DNA/RNA helicase n=1 Tax=Nonlabens dokdonensis TaxID=328515 RepID=A0A1Z8B1R8_9FLAO|nr:AAA domain-containing protein [Nonlabens dokdonensis]OUS16529.1 DNA/RNA helicase [Nonlabens dokdonensis]
MSDYKASFFALLDELKEYGGSTTQDFIARVLPLLEKAHFLRSHNKVLGIYSIDDVYYNGRTLVTDSEGKEFKKGPNRILTKPTQRYAVEVSGNYSEISKVEGDDYDRNIFDDQAIQEDLDKPVTKPVYLPFYKSWDLATGHYDPLTEVFTLGFIMASVAYAIDFRDKDELKKFIENRERLYFYNKDLHPTIHHVIREMTPLYREDRAPSLEEIIAKLKNYRDFNPENYVDLTDTEGFRNLNLSDRGSYILDKLKRRLFDISKRNKLLYFNDRGSFMNLTEASIPMLLDYKNISEKDLIFWSSHIEQQFVSKKKVNLNKYLDLRRNRFLAPALNKLRLEARKSKNEYGFDQLRVVVAFLHWYNFKESEEERISSPLLLLPVSLTKKKGIKDKYELTINDTEAEINPVLSYYLKDLYDINLPDFVNLETSSVEDLVQSIRNQISLGGTGIDLQWRDQPKIQLIHKIAKRNFKLKKRKLNNRNSGLSTRNYDYSYESDNLKPLGLAIFNDLIAKKHNELEYIINEDINPYSDLAVAERRRSFYHTDNDGEVNPLVWEVDTCNITLGNFNYRKMSLVRDYSEIIKADIKDEVFDELFSDQPKNINLEGYKKTKLEELYPIIQSDPTQSQAVLKARSGENYIIQGPPGTGKSQTITNLIADYVARDQKVLFVCEKRAALDVVFHRLKNKKLDELCCLIHDSQTDKKSFIMNLKDTYESFMKKDMNTVSLSRKREKTIQEIESHLSRIEQFHDKMRDGEPPLYELYQVLIQYYQEKELLSDRELIYLPFYKEWNENQTWITDFIAQIKLNNHGNSIADYSLNGLSNKLLDAPNAKAAVLEKIDVATAALDSFIELLDNQSMEVEEQSIDAWKKEFEFAQKISNIIEKDALGIFDKNSIAASELDNLNRKLEKQKKLHERFVEENKLWTQKFNATDAQTALEKWNKLDGSFFKFLNPSWYQLKKQVKGAYNFGAHQIVPEIGSVLRTLNEEYTALTELEEQRYEAAQRFGLKDYLTDYAWIEEQQREPDAIIKKWLSSDYSSYVRSLLNFSNRFETLYSALEELFCNFGNTEIAVFDQKLQVAKNSVHTLGLFTPFIKQLHKTSPAMQENLRVKDWQTEDIAFHTAFKSVKEIYEKDPVFSQSSEDRLSNSVQKISSLLDAYYNSNVDFIRSKIRDQFLNKVRITESVAAQLTEEEKELKKKYNASRRILENEFGKSMRYKSIRELATGDAQDIMTTLKPVWLMSPLSVSDSMPIDTSIFDVVIYDEASQITVEEGVPSLFRTHQTIIVGDEMQMPPTNFFSSNAVDQEEDEEEIEERTGINLDADSLLNQGARKLSSVMLGWHYRSRRESLISFSNAAFYKRNLLTIPDSRIPNAGIDPLPPIIDPDQEIDPTNILNRSISFHYLENAVYHKRTNKDEAAYIANLVRTFLLNDIKKSIGIVAFSMAQQSVIEEELEQLALEYPHFGRLLEEEFQRTEEDQFIGLFVKNLENVQGDERDIIIMSICYGFNNKGKMFMNFGPINRRGGEKRLNVIFSRAKQNMIVVSSIQSEHIKNDYNEGANYFKRFLKYAKNISDGQLAAANSVLDSLHLHEDEEEKIKRLPIIQQLTTLLEEKGYQVDDAVGQSHFKCDLAVKQSDSSSYLLAILIDRSNHYRTDDILEQYCQKPSVLKAFGWKLQHVYSKDWLEQPERVIEKIMQKLEGKEEENESEIKNELEAESQTESEETTEDISIKESETIEETTSTTLEARKQETSKDDLTFKRYEFSEGSSNKFWEIAVDGFDIVTRYGRIGNSPQESRKELKDQVSVLKEEMRLIGVKTRKGYRPV